MRKFSRLAAIAASVVVAHLTVTAAHAVDYTWATLAGGTANWEDVANWGGAGYPNAILDSANLNVALTANLNLNINAPITVGSLTLGGSAGAVTTNIGNGLTNSITFNNTGGVNNSDGNANASITSGGVAGSINIISAPIALTLNTNITRASTNNLSLAGGIVVTGNNIFPNLVTNLAAGQEVHIGNVTSEATADPTATVNNILQLGNSNNAVDSRGTIYLDGVISNGAPRAGFSVNTRVTLGQAGANNANTINTIVINGNNTYSGATNFFRANIVVNSDTAFGTSSLVHGGGSASGSMGYNFISTDDARSIVNNVQMSRNLTVRGEHSFTFGGIWKQSNASNFFNLLPEGKTVTFTNILAGDNSAGGRAFTFDGPGKTIVTGEFAGGIDASNVTAAGIGAVIKNGTGHVVLSNANNKYGNYTLVNGGILEFAVEAANQGVMNVVHPGGAIGLTSGITSAYLSKFTSAINGAGLDNESRGSLAISSADAATNFDYVGDANLSHSKLVGTSIGSLSAAGVTYTGTITPSPAVGYRLGGGGLLIVPGANALTGANSLTVTNGGTVSLTGTNNNSGNTLVEGNFVVTQAALAESNAGNGVLTSAYVGTTLSVAHLADGASSIGSGAVTVNGGTLKYEGATDQSTARGLNIGGRGATLDSSGAGAITYSGAVTAPDVSGITGDTTTNTAVNNISDITGLSVGMTVSSAGGEIPVGATITGIRATAGNETGSNLPGKRAYTILLSANGTLATPTSALTFGNQARTLTLGGSNTGNNTISSTLANSATGALSVNKSGAGKWIVSGNNTYTGATTVNAGTLALGHVNALGATSGTTVKSGATLAIATASADAVKIDNAKLTRESGSKLDMLKGKLVLDYTGASPLATVKADIISGYAAGAFNGNGITTTDSVGGKKLRVGYAEATDLALAGTYFGQAVDADAIILAGTFAGDTDLNGTVNFDDLLKLAQNYGGTGKEWVQGDSDYNGSVDFDDLLSLAQSYNSALVAVDTSSFSSTFSSDWALALSIVPEPVSLSGVMALGMLAGRRRRA